MVIRILLHLKHLPIHLALLFLDEVEKDEKCTTVSKEAYEATLMKYHPWVVQVQYNVQSSGSHGTVHCTILGSPGTVHCTILG